MWVKICGIKDLETAAAVAERRPDAIGLNFYPKSPRCVAPETAAEIVTLLPPTVEAVGVFVNHEIETVAAICRDCRLGTAQMHGDETPQQLAELRLTSPELKIVRGHRMGGEGIEPLETYLTTCQQQGVELTACLIDARVEGTYGGSGQVAPWSLLAEQYQRRSWPPLILAGGLNPANVAGAIEAVAPWGVDVASGVESSPGQKDLQAVEWFIASARGRSSA